VVAPAVGGPLDLVDHGLTGYLVVPGDAGAFAGAVARLAGDPRLRREMGRAGREKMMGRSWRALGDQLIAHYSAVVGRPWRAFPLDLPARPRAEQGAGVPR
jgi:phosphatidylinositol alpha 1,6-mannosyltransferase